MRESIQAAVLGGAVSFIVVRRGGDFIQAAIVGAFTGFLYAAARSIINKKKEK
jgi:hypothetical protein